MLGAGGRRLKEDVEALALQQELRGTLAELERLHEREAVTLKALDRDALDALTEEKLVLFQRLSELTAQVRPEAEDQKALERLRHAALLNQILIHHARDAVRTILQMAGGQVAAPTASIRPQAIQGGMRIDWRG